MSNIPADLKYAKSHEWARDNGDGTITVGISDHAQEALGDLVFVEVPEVGDHASAGEDLAVVESVKAASDVYSPISGEVLQANEALADSPELVNDSPYEDGWIAVLKPDDASEMDALLDAEGYESSLED